ncbi:MAG TPA: pseudouridine synthase [Paenibacillaceae bacterium]
MKPSMRLDKMLAHEGYGTRSDIKRLIREGAVTVNGRPVSDPGMHVRPAEDEVCVHGRAVTYREFRYIMLHKPAGVVSATEDARERTVLGLLPDDLRWHGLFPVGRLDKDAEGLLLLTNDGKLAHGLTSPRKAVYKIYRALVRGKMDAADAEAFAAGVALDDGYVTMPARLTVLASMPAAALAEAASGIGEPPDGERASGEAGSPDAAGAPGAAWAPNRTGLSDKAQSPGEAESAEAEAILEMRQAARRLAEEPALNRSAWEEAVRDGATVSWVELAIREGKFHQVKRMFAAAGKKVLYLRRVAVGALRLDPALEPGQWRELTPDEEEALRGQGRET